jgi:hypothetical protein
VSLGDGLWDGSRLAGLEQSSGERQTDKEVVAVKENVSLDALSLLFDQPSQSQDGAKTTGLLWIKVTATLGATFVNQVRKNKPSTRDGTGARL